MSGASHQQLNLKRAGCVLTLSVIAEAHLCLAKTDRIFSSTDSIEFLELRLINTLASGQSYADG